MKYLGTKNIETNEHLIWYGDTLSCYSFGDSDSLNLNVYNFKVFPDLFYLIPSEAYSGSGFAPSGVWQSELEFCKLLAFARISTKDLMGFHEPY